jgi:hypothetical protein
MNQQHDTGPMGRDGHRSRTRVRKSKSMASSTTETIISYSSYVTIPFSIIVALREPHYSSSHSAPAARTHGMRVTTPPMPSQAQRARRHQHNTTHRHQEYTVGRTTSRSWRWRRRHGALSMLQSRRSSPHCGKHRNACLVHRRRRRLSHLHNSWSSS